MVGLFFTWQLQAPPSPDVSALVLLSSGLHAPHMMDPRCKGEREVGEVRKMEGGEIER